jgi:DNA-directed RNA polymerase I, II, and III subunit RPABC1
MSDVEMSDAAEAPTTPTIISLSPEASRLFRVYKTISGMLDKRGYMIPKSMREMTPSDFLQKFGEYPNREALTILVVRT